jgi:hypothetical protein
MTPELEPFVILAKCVLEQEASNTYRTAGIEDLDSIELGLLGNTICLGTDSTSTVGAVAIAVGVFTITGEVGEERGTTLELRVSGLNTSVDNVHTRACTSTFVIGV